MAHATFCDYLKKLKKPIIVGIAGDSGSGKTTYSNGIRHCLGTSLVTTITMDGYHRENRAEREKSGILPLDPVANKLDLLAKHLEILKNGQPVMLPIYDHNQGVFVKPVEFKPSPIIIIEGLHALYSAFLPFYDFTIFVDPDRKIKWEWKFNRDVVDRHHNKSSLVREMLKREGLYKRFIDFQKIEADVIVKIHESQLPDMARYDLVEKLPDKCYKAELIMRPLRFQLPYTPLPLDLSAMLNFGQPPFMLAAVPSSYWGREMMVLHTDGIISPETIKALEKHLINYTGINPEKALSDNQNSFPHEQMFATQFAQLIITWCFLEKIKSYYKIS